MAILLTISSDFVIAISISIQILNRFAVWLTVQVTFLFANLFSNTISTLFVSAGWFIGQQNPLPTCGVRFQTALHA